MSKIEWTEKTWNPVRGCSIVSKGCTNCYAMKQAHRFSGPGGKYEGLTIMTNGGPVWSGDIRLVPEKLTEPLHWKQPRMVFVNSMSDLFHEGVPDEFIDKVFAVMALTPQHTFQVLTKRAKRMRDYLVTLEHEDQIERWYEAGLTVTRDPHADEIITGIDYPLRNVWLGASVEDQPTADERIPLLLQTPAAVRFVSYEPALGPVTFTGISSVPACFNALLVGRYPRLDWIIVGGESGPGARPFDITWARSTVGQCRDAGVPVFIKQLGTQPRSPCDSFGMRQEDVGGRWAHTLKDRKGGDMAEWPEDLRVREFPKAA